MQRMADFLPVMRKHHPPTTTWHPLHPGRERLTMPDHFPKGATMPDVICPHCGRLKKVTDDVFASISGKSVRCSGCKAEFVVEAGGMLDFLNSPAEAVTPPKIVPQLSKEEREAIAERNVGGYWSGRHTKLAVEILREVWKLFVWGFVAFLVIGVSAYSGRASSGGIGVLVFVASLIAILLYQVIDLLLRIVALLEKD